jgi:uncharacterized protein (DUF1778 family)
MQPQTGNSNHQSCDVIINIKVHQSQPDLIDCRLFVLDDEKFQQFMELLDAPPSANLALRKMLTTKAPWE